MMRECAQRKKRIIDLEARQGIVAPSLLDNRRGCHSVRGRINEFMAVAHTAQCDKNFAGPDVASVDTHAVEAQMGIPGKNRPARVDNLGSIENTSVYRNGCRHLEFFNHVVGQFATQRPLAVPGAQFHTNWATARPTRKRRPYLPSRFVSFVGGAPVLPMWLNRFRCNKLYRGSRRLLQVGRRLCLWPRAARHWSVSSWAAEATGSTWLRLLR